MTANILLLTIFIPLLAGVITCIIPRKLRGVAETITLLSTLFNFLLAVKLFAKNIEYSIPWGNFGLEFSLRLYHFSGFIVLATAGFGLLISLYSSVFMSQKNYANQFLGLLLISVGLVNGAVLADNLIVMLLFWEGMLLPVFAMIAIGNKEAFNTAIKALIILGITDLCLMFGTILTACSAGTLAISKIHLPLNSLGSLAFVFLMIGAIAKAGAMPFHSWIPDAATDAPLPFMALLPAALEKLLGIYFLARISLDMFKLDASSWVSTLMMTIGVITILFAVMMALVQKDYKKLLSYHAISQVGYMILGIGTCVPAGIVGGLFHMINHSMYKGCLFLTSGAVERQAGTTSLEKLGGLVSRMPVTFICFVIAAASISGVPPFNGFFSKELIYDGALERGWIFYLIAVLGSFFTAASFLKLGHTVFLGRLNAVNKNTREAPLPMLIPMIVIAFLCVLFGVYNSLPIKGLIQPILGEARLEGHNFSGMPANIMLVIATLVVIILAIFNHRWGVRRSGSALEALDHIHYAPGLSFIYERAEKKYFDPYEIGLQVLEMISKAGWFLDRGIDWIYNHFIVQVTYLFSDLVRKLHNGSYSRYVAWSLIGSLLALIFIVKG